MTLYMKNFMVYTHTYIHILELSEFSNVVGYKLKTILFLYNSKKGIGNQIFLNVI